MMDTMEADLSALLTELYERGQEHDARQQKHADRLRNLDPRYRCSYLHPHP